ncbi:helix-turn-helix domain-containing protein [Nonomuraea sp. SYSU D8015]|uniref:helix-turn-helix domain-containing protein n=1 Tax=Nonomuraea sp. SYSU D8015 TaxID=2593644 RepID=UPI001CB71788|nr:helix-turn-helix domain-containing protein [Nonomuraea sp. SYSU D8015]
MDVVNDWNGAMAGVLRQAYHYSQREFAKRLGVDPRTIVKWEGNPNLQQESEQQQILDMALWTAPDHVKARFAHLLSRQTDPIRDPTREPQVVPESQEWTDDDMNRREMLRLFTMAGAVIATPQASQALDLDRIANRATRPDTETITQYETLNTHLWQVFMLASSKRKVYPLVQDHLATLVDALQRSTTETTHRQLCALAGDLFQLAGEIHFDGNQYTDAAHCYTLAASASREAAAYDLWACAMTRHAFIGVYERQYATAAPMLDLAATLARRGNSSLSTRHWVAAVRAETLAGLGDFDSCQRALDDAEQVRNMTGTIHNGGWLRFDGGRLHEERGTCYTMLRRPDLAEQVLAGALAHNLTTRRRGGVLVDLASLGVQRGDRDQLLDYGRAAVELARRTGSGVIAQKLRGLQDQMTALPVDDRLRALHNDINELATAS